MKNKKIALFHPWIKSNGGAEKVVLELAKTLNFQVDIYTWVYDKKNTFQEFENLDVKVIIPDYFKKLSRLKFLRGLFLLIGFFSKIPLEKYDKFLISTSGVGEFIVFRNYKPGETYAYVHTPLREASDKIILWNLKNKEKSFFSKWIYLSLVRIYKIFENLAWKKIDHVIFNSQLSKERAKEHGLINSKRSYIVHPPVEIPKKLKLKNGNFFLYVSRINPPKRQKELVKAFKIFSKENPGIKLILVGGNEDNKYYNEIKKMSEGLNIELKSNLSFEELNNLYQNCKAGIFLGYNEDFGIAPLEVIGRGKPLIAVDEGGFVDLIKENPLFYKIKEKHDSLKMVKEIENALENFILKKNLGKSEKLKLKNFSSEMNRIIKA